MAVLIPSSLSQASYSLLNRGAVVISGFINVLIMVRILPQRDIGTWVLFTTMASILEMIRSGFVRNSFISHFVSSPENDRPSVTTAALLLQVFLAIIMSLMLLLAAEPLASFWKAPDLTDLLLIYAVNTILFIPFLHFEDILTAHLHFRAVFICNVVRAGTLTTFVGMIFLLDFSTRLTHIAIVQLIATVAAAVVGYLYVRKVVRYSFKLNYKLVLDLFHFGKFTFGTNMSSMFIRSTDSWLIGRLMSTAAVAIYNPALKLVNIFEVPTIAIANYIFPQIHTAMQRGGKDGIRRLYLRSVSLMLTLIFPMVIPLFVFSEFFVATIFGPEYLEAADILRVTILYSLILPFNRQFGTVMDGLKKPKLNFYLLVLTAAFNVIFNLVGLKMFGLIGSAWGTFLSYGILFAINQLILYKIFKINSFDVIPLMLQWYVEIWRLCTRRRVTVANGGGQM